jgi:putative transposase
MSELPDRHRPAHYTPVELGNRAILIFLTVCTKERMPCLASDDIHQILRESWTAASGWRTGRYVVLSDHVHLFCAPACWPPPPMHSWVRYWKRLATVQIRKIHDEFQWQRDYWDTQLRQGESYSEKWAYVEGNPVRHGLVDSADQWPYQGEIHCLEWHDV